MSIHIESKGFIPIKPQPPKTVNDFYNYCIDLFKKYDQYDQRPVFPFDLYMYDKVCILSFDNNDWLKPFNDFYLENKEVFDNFSDTHLVWLDTETGYMTSVIQFREDMIARDKDDHQYFSVTINS